jgi:hypothetical protein
MGPDIVVLAVEGEDWVPAAFGEYQTPPEGAGNGTATAAKRTSLACSRPAREVHGPLVVHNLAFPSWPLGIRPEGQTRQGAIVSALNEEIASVARETDTPCRLAALSTDTVHLTGTTSV